MVPKLAGWQIIVSETAEDAHRCLQRQHEIADEVCTGARKPTIFIWRSQRALVVTNRQARWPEFEVATAQLAKMGWPALVRKSGGGAFPLCPGTVQIAIIAKISDQSLSMDDVYDQLSLLISTALAEFGLVAGIGNAPGAFCDGGHDILVGDRKIAGLAQYWRLGRGGERCITAAASVLIDVELGELAAIVDRFHAACKQTINIRPDAMTTLREWSNAQQQRNLPADFIAHLATAAAKQTASV